jgi:hypothetical protein
MRQKRALMIVAVIVLVGLACTCGSIENITQGIQEGLQEFQQTGVASEAAPLPLYTEPPLIIPTQAVSIPTEAEGPSGVLFADDFSDPSSGWEVGEYSTGSVGYENGAYFVLASSEDSTMWGVAPQGAYSDVAIEVDATQVMAPANDNNSYGVICRLQDDNSGYLLRISGDGYFSIGYSEPSGDVSPLLDWQESAVIQQGNATNHIRVVCKGSHLALYANGVLLGEVDDTRYPSGGIALTATSYEAEPTRILFDDIVFMAP